jgi:uncharacterized membrane protein
LRAGRETVLLGKTAEGAAMTYSFDLGQVVSLIFFVGSILVFYFRGESRTDSKLAVYAERIKQIEDDLETLKNVGVRLAVIGERLGALQQKCEPRIPDRKCGSQETFKRIRRAK